MEVDYQMALLLQHKFEREHREKKNAELSDKLLAKLLQDEFQKESGVTAAGPSLIPPESNKVDKLLNSSKCLTDPSWELNDPTPDIHLLFVVFSQKFFWDKLGSVTVSWSKRMTTCAGICSYSGRGGMCVITLSEPLLKLRPRKDLVETLLHEMIHAFLFVTHNNRDRDGHGPEFHKHMFRINKEAGTNITVYHSFHDEVRLYQQHWWRCNGPCQHRGPYFGMVRRATNRAPGHYDRWWNEHSRTCGGTFLKVREPEKKCKGKAPLPAKPANNIKNYFGSTNGPTSGSNIKTLKDLGGSTTKGRSNSSSTIVTTKDSPRDNTYKPTQINTKQIENATKNSKKPTKASNTTSIKSQNTTNDFINVRSHWQNKFTDSAKPSTSNSASKRVDEYVCPKPSTSNSASKRPNEYVCPRSSKLQKTVPIDEGEPNNVECPVCRKKVPIEKLNEHLDVCLETGGPGEELKKCEICNEQVKILEYDQHAEKCVLKIYDGIENEVDVSCLACGKKIKRLELNAHLDECMVNIFTDKKGDAEEEKPDGDQFNCPFCMELVDEIDMKEHLDVCLKNTNLYDFLE